MFGHLELSEAEEAGLLLLELDFALELDFTELLEATLEEDFAELED
jgi:hypothetical protein